MKSRTKIIIITMNGFQKPIFAALLLLAGILNWASAQEQLTCYDFEDFDRGVVVGTSSNNEPGDAVFERNGLKVALAHFDEGANAEPLFGDAAIIRNEVPPNVDPYLIIGNHLLLEEISLDFAFANDSQYAEKICFNYINTGGTMNLSVNGEDLWLTGDLNELNGEEIAPGVFISVSPFNTNTTTGGKVCLEGKIHSLLFGGKRVLVDELCYRLSPGNCALEGVTAYIQNCIPTLPSKLVIDIDLAFQPQLTTHHQSFSVFLNGEFWGTHSYREFPLVLYRFPQTDYLKVRVCANNLLECCVETEVEYLTCPPENCIDFNELEAGTVWGRDGNHEPGDLVYEKEGVKTTVEKFQYFDGTTDFWNVKVEEDIFGTGFPHLDGNELFISNINLKFDFSALEQTVEGLCFDFIDGGGEENFSVNGEPVKVLNSLQELQGQEVAPGVWLYITPYPSTTAIPTGRLCLKGKIESLIIGGQEFGFDNLCLRLDDENDCEIKNLVIKPLPCTPNGIFYAEMKFEVESPSSDSYIVWVDGRMVGKYAYADDFPKIGPFRGNDNTFHRIVVHDSENRRCADHFLLEPVHCNPDCGIGNLKAYVKSCNEDGSYNLLVDLDHHNSQQIGFDLYIEGQFYAFHEYEQLPIVIEGFVPVTDGLEFELKVCENDNNDCCISTTVDLRNPCPVSECIDFEDWPEDGVWGQQHGNVPGDVIFTGNTYAVSLHPFDAADWTNVFGELSIEKEDATDIHGWGGNGQYLSYEHISAEFDFANHPGGVQMLSFDFRLENGPMIIGVNGDLFVTIFNRERPGMYSLTDGVMMEIIFDANDRSSGKVIIKGDIHKLLIGGADLDIDNICLNKRPECNNIYDLTVEATPCTEDGKYYVELDFEYENEGEAFEIWFNGNVLSTHHYSELPLKFGPFQAPLEEILHIKVKDKRNYGCYAETTLGPVYCEECRIYNVKKEIVCHPETATYDLLLKFDHVNTNSDGFKVVIDGEVYGPFAYEQLPVKIEGLPWTEQAYHTLLVCDLSAETPCCAEMRYEIECNTDCNIGELRTWVSDCDENGEYWIKLDFEHENTSGEFWVTTNVNRQAFGPYSYADLPVEIGPLPAHPDINVAVTVQDAEFQDCTRRKTVGVIDCEPDCHLFDPVFGEPVCDPTSPNRVIDVKFDFEYENVGSEYFVVTTEQGWTEKYKYADLPVLLEDVHVPAGQDYLYFKICDSNTDGCCLEAKLWIPCLSEPCEIGELKTEVSECVDGVFKVALNFDHARTSGKFWVLTNTLDVPRGPFAYEDLPVVLENIPAAAGGEVILTVKDKEYENCVNRKSLGVIDCGEECNIYDITFGEPVCNDAGNKVNVKLDFEYEHVGSEYFVVKYEDGRAPRHKYADLPVLLENVPIPEGLNRIWIKVYDAEIDGCHQAAELTVNCQPECRIGSLRTEVSECENGEYKVWLKFEHENTSGHFWVTNNITDQAFGPFEYGDLPVVIGPLPASNEEIILTVKDGENPECARRKSLGVINCPCEIGELITEVSDCVDGNYKVWLNFRHENTSGQFWVTANVTDQAFGPFDYADLPVVVDPLPGSNEPVILTVTDKENPNCGRRKSLGIIECPPPECGLSELRHSEVACNPENNTFSVKINFEVTGQHSDYFVLTLENGREGRFKYEDLPLELEGIPYPEEGDLFRFKVCDAEFDDCCLGGEIEIPCETNPCEIGPLQLEPTACNSDGMYMVDMKFRGFRASEKFELYVNGDLVDRFYYDELPIRVGPYPGDGETSLHFRVVDASGGCESEGTLDPITCDEECTIAQIIAEPHECDDGMYLVDLEVRASNPGLLGYYVFADGQISGPHSYSEPFITIGPFPGDGVTVADILVLDIGDPSCFGYVEIGPLECGEDCVIEEVELEAKPCLPNGTFFVKVEVEAENTGTSGFRILVNNEVYGEEYGYDEEYVVVGPLEADGETIYDIAVVDNEHADCVKVATLGPVFCQTENVWPGDANSDNVVQHFDLLNIGLAYMYEGPPRSADMATAAWEGVFALPWGKNFANGLNYKHADCNGDGIVNEEDAAIIKLNYGRDHGTREELPSLPATDTDPPIFAEIPQSGELIDGDEFHIPIHLGEMTASMEDIYGIAFSLFFDPEFIDPSSLWIEYPASWLGEKGINMITLDTIFEIGRIDMALSRTDLNEVSGYGQVAILHGIIDDIAGRTETEIRMDHILAIDLMQNRLPLRQSITRLNIDPQDIPSDILGGVEVYPNPTQDWITIRNEYNLPIESVELFTVNGQRVRMPLLDTNQISLAGLEGGIYFLRLKIGGAVIHKKIIKK